MEGEDSTSRGGDDDPDQERDGHETEDDGSGLSKNMLSTTDRQFIRNQAEKQRRDKLNAFITELSNLVPIINCSTKKLDKTSILRLTATYIRLHNVVHARKNLLPEFLTSINWSENVLEDIGGGMMLIVTGAGKIIYVSNGVEKILGHTQIELMGHSLYSLTCLEDHDELKKNLLPSDYVGLATASSDIGSADSESDTSSNPASPIQTQGLKLHQFESVFDIQSSNSSQRRSFFIRLRQRAVSKNDHPQYELVHIVGHLRVPPKKYPHPSTSRKRESQLNSNDIVLVAVARPFKEKRLTYLSLSEAYREEFITRHAVDGHIIYTDHRISTVSGYLTEEVVGVPGFKFMHKDDMRWTMIALRQMYYRGHSYGSSVYRLQSKTGDFIYLKTHGYLEINEANNDVQSFLCINTLVSEDEGYSLIHKMKDLYTPLVRNKYDNALSMLVDNCMHLDEVEDNSSSTVDNPVEMKTLIQYMLSDIAFHPTSDTTAGLEEEDLIARRKFAEAQILAKTMPSITEMAAKVGVKVLSLNTSSTHLAQSRSVQAQKNAIKNTPPAATCRPSVLRSPPYPKHQLPAPTVINQVSVVKRLRTDEQGHGVVISENCTISHTPQVIVAAGKRKHEDDVEWVQPDVEILPSPPFPYPCIEQPIYSLQPEEIHPANLLDSFSEFMSDINNPDSLPHLENEYEFPCLSQGANQVWDKPDQLLNKSHYSLGNNLVKQETQINAIEQAIDSIPRPNRTEQELTEIKAELFKEKQTLFTLQQDYQSIQHAYSMD